MPESDYVGPVPGSSVVYVLVGDRAKFDQIGRPATVHAPLPDGRQVISKTIGNWAMSSGDGLVIFQHWLKAPEEASEASQITTPNHKAAEGDHS